MNKIRAGESPPLADLQPEHAQYPLAACFKAGFYFVRAYQDALYRVFLRLFDQPIRAKTSMFSAVQQMEKGNSRNPAVQRIQEKYPDYGPWFLGFRKKRDQIKHGIGTAFAFTVSGDGSTDVSVIFDRIA